MSLPMQIQEVHVIVLSSLICGSDSNFGKTGLDTPDYASSVSVTDCFSGAA